MASVENTSDIIGQLQCVCLSFSNFLVAVTLKMIVAAARNVYIESQTITGRYTAVLMVIITMVVMAPSKLVVASLWCVVTPLAMCHGILIALQGILIALQAILVALHGIVGVWHELCVHRNRTRAI